MKPTQSPAVLVHKTRAGLAVRRNAYAGSAPPHFLSVLTAVGGNRLDTSNIKRLDDAINHEAQASGSAPGYEVIYAEPRKY